MLYQNDLKLVNVTNNRPSAENKSKNPYTQDQILVNNGQKFAVKCVKNQKILASSNRLIPLKTKTESKIDYLEDFAKSPELLKNRNFDLMTPDILDSKTSSFKSPELSFGFKLKNSGTSTDLKQRYSEIKNKMERDNSLLQTVTASMSQKLTFNQNKLSSLPAKNQRKGKLLSLDRPPIKLNSLRNSEIPDFLKVAYK